MVYDVFKPAVLTGDGRCQLGALVLGAPVSLWDPEGEPTGPAGSFLRCFRADGQRSGRSS